MDAAPQTPDGAPLDAASAALDGGPPLPAADGSAASSDASDGSATPSDADVDEDATVAGLGTGFSATDMHWQVPRRGAPDGFFTPANTLWSTFDIDGDHKPDLVLTHEDSQPVFGGDGTAHWRVYSNTGNGFASTAARWSVPARGHPDGYFTTASEYWSTFDINGDHKPDLVLTHEDSQPVFGGDGAAHWRVHLNTGSGFASTATQWSVPARGHPDGYFITASEYWSTFDINGDGRPDLVHTHDNSQPVFGGDGAAHWRVHLNTGSGFASTATQWSVPARRVPDGFFTPANTLWSTFDINGDHKPDLVLTHEDSQPVFGGDGAAHWRVYSNTGSGFASTAARWSVPARGHPDGYFITASEYWSTFDINGDGRPDLVHTYDNSQPVFGGDGAAHWRVYFGAP